jgi:hypothetical protein
VLITMTFLGADYSELVEEQTDFTTGMDHLSCQDHDVGDESVFLEEKQ